MEDLDKLTDLAKQVDRILNEELQMMLEI